MAKPLSLTQDDGTIHAIAWVSIVSVVGHVVVIGAVALLSMLGFRHEAPPPSYEVSLIAPIIKGTPGGGSAAAAIRPPPGTAETPPPPNLKTAPAAAEKTAMTVPEKPPKKDTVKEALEHAKLEAKLEKLAALEAARHAKTAETPDPAATPQAANPLPATTPGKGSGDGKGNGGVDYGTWDGLPGSATYEQQIQAIIDAAWDHLPIDPAHPIICRVHVIIGFDGAIIAPEIVDGSPNASFDASTLAAFRKVGKFPPPPSELKLYLAHVGKTFSFDSNKKNIASR